MPCYSATPVPACILLSLRHRSTLGCKATTLGVLLSQPWGALRPHQLKSTYVAPEPDFPKFFQYGFIQPVVQLATSSNVARLVVSLHVCAFSISSSWSTGLPALRKI